MDENDIRDYLLANPDYLQNNPDLLGVLQIPHASGSAVSLVERQVSVLRERNVDLRHRLRDLGSNARHNDQLFEETRALVLALLEAADLEARERALLAVLRDRFHVEHASLLLFSEAFGDEGPLRRVAESQLRGHVGGLLARKQAGCGALRPEAFGFLFPGSRTVGSAAVALISSHEDKPLGALALGSSDAAHYSDDMGTLFLDFAAEVLARLLDAERAR
ncbi:MAG: DUF484 family protein [Halieaceae bacterium]|nr:DUF484 family protein [Halieaceae bacterium]